MSTYLVIYDNRFGNPISINKGNSFIPISMDNIDFRDFLKWNETQNPPLDYTTPIAPAPIFPDPAEVEAKNATEIYKLTPDQAAIWSEKQAIGDTTKSSLLLDLDNVTTIAMLKPIVIAIIQVLYKIVEINKIQIKLLIALRNKTMPTLGD